MTNGLNSDANATKHSKENNVTLENYFTSLLTNDANVSRVKYRVHIEDNISGAKSSRPGLNRVRVGFPPALPR